MYEYWLVSKAPLIEFRFFCNLIFLKYFLLVFLLLISSEIFIFLVQISTDLFFFARISAIAVPQEPAPITNILFFKMLLVSV